MAYTDPSDAVTGVVAPAAMWNSGVRDNFRAMGPHLLVRKTADESVASSVAFQADEVLLFPVAANEIWLTEWVLLYTAAAAADLQYRFTFPTGGSLVHTSIFPNAADTVAWQSSSGTTSPTTAIQVAGNAAILVLHDFRLVYINGANAGNVVLEWAQVTSNATATVMKANSTLWGVKLA